MAASKRMRIDQLLVQRGLAESRTRAQALVMAGVVFSGESRIDKPGQQISPDAAINMRGRDHPWVSRGGLKLDHALQHFEIDVSDKIALDLGASTGGFTDVLLSRSAARVYAVDVGHGQLAWSLRQDERVVVLEKTNVRTLDAALVPDPPEVIVGDLSFISLTVGLPAALALAAPGAVLVVLIKPQFEAGADQVGKAGVVRDRAVHDQVCESIRSWLSDESGWTVLGITDSPVTGAAGNREFLIAASKPA
ncbi:MAG: TlyA family RNA methyltransferase [Rhodospirillales bacterium]|nr:TlyA family RNA methyltransferase [Rhodospirillales bacterium]